MVSPSTFSAVTPVDAKTTACRFVVWMKCRSKVLLPVPARLVTNTNALPFSILDKASLKRGVNSRCMVRALNRAALVKASEAALARCE